MTAQNLNQMRCEMTSSNVEECALRARSTHGVHHAIVEINIVIGVMLWSALFVYASFQFYLFYCNSRSHSSVLRGFVLTPAPTVRLTHGPLERLEVLPEMFRHCLVTQTNSNAIVRLYTESIARIFLKIMSSFTTLKKKELH